MSKPFSIRDAVPADARIIHGFVCELAEYERLAHEVSATPELLAEALSGDHPRAFAMIAEVDAKPVGFALSFYNFSTFLGRSGIYIEDIYVQPAHRGAGIGAAFFKRLAQKAKREGCGRMEWSVLNWNAPALGFYGKLGAKPMSEWQTQRLTGAALDALAA